MMSCRDLDGRVTVQKPKDDLAERGWKERKRRMPDSCRQLGVLGIEIGGEPGVGGLDEGGRGKVLLVTAPFPKRGAEQVPGDGGDVPVRQLRADPRHRPGDADQGDLREVFGRIVGKAVSEVRQKGRSDGAEETIEGAGLILLRVAHQAYQLIRRRPCDVAAHAPKHQSLYLTRFTNEGPRGALPIDTPSVAGAWLGVRAIQRHLGHLNAGPIYAGRVNESSKGGGKGVCASGSQPGVRQ